MKYTTAFFITLAFLMSTVPYSTHASLYNVNIDSPGIIYRDAPEGASATTGATISPNLRGGSNLNINEPPGPPIKPVMRNPDSPDGTRNTPLIPSMPPVRQGDDRSKDLPPVPPIQPIGKNLADCAGITIHEPKPKSEVGEKNDVTVSPGKLEYDNSVGDVNGDIEQLVFITLQNASKESSDDLKNIMEQMQETLKEKAQQRDNKRALDAEKAKIKRLLACELKDAKTTIATDVTLDDYFKALGEAGDNLNNPKPKESDASDNKDSKTPIFLKLDLGLAPSSDEKTDTKVPLFPFQVKSSDDLKLYLEHKGRATPGVENITIQNDALDVTLKRKAKLFGFVPLSYTANVSADGMTTKVRGPWWLFAAKDDLGNLKDSLSEMGQPDQLQLQLAMDRQEKFAEMLSEILKKSSEAANNILPNLK